MSKTPKTSKVEQEVRLRSIGDFSSAYQWLFNQQRAGQIDHKTAAACNTTLQGSMFIHIKLPLEVAKIMLQAQIKKVDLPKNLLPEMVTR